MRYFFTSQLLALALASALTSAAGAATVNISGSLSGDSTSTPTQTPGVFVQNLSGDGDDDTFGAFTLTSQSNVDFSAPPSIVFSGGMLTETFANGTLIGTSSGSGTADGQGTATVTIDIVITGGTGFFTGAAGEVTFTGTLTRTSATTQSLTGTYMGTLSNVPEPSGLALLVSGATVAFGVIVRRRTKSQ